MDEVNMRHVRTEEQRALYERIAAAGICSFCVDFCQGNVPTYHPKPVLRETKYWSLTECFPKYDGARAHFLLVYKEHVSGPPLPPEAWADLGKLTEWVLNAYGLRGASLLVRMGDTDYTGGSITHFHAQLICGGEKSGEALRVKVGYVRK
ncbi:MAG TPA: HIT family protein [Candidatus Paceibacterota bacterium]|nr:HIT family protein [Candidatus Paceibacterota bacterium]